MVLCYLEEVGRRTGTGMFDVEEFDWYFLFCHVLCVSSVFSNKMKNKLSQTFALR